MKRLILVGSPRTNGRSAHLGEELFEALIEDCPEDELFLIPISEIDVAPCIYCNGCCETSEVITKDDNGNEVSCQKHRCVVDDDMQAVYDIIDDVDEIIVVCPVFFSGAPAPFKSLLDRLQPYYWAKARLGEKRPATLHVIGEGGDPHGYGALVSEVRSALAVAGFRLERVLDWVGKIDVNGEIMAEAEEHLLDNTSVFGDSGVQDSLPSFKNKMESSWAIAEGARGEEEGSRRPKLNLTQARKTSGSSESKRDQGKTGSKSVQDSKRDAGGKGAKGKADKSSKNGSKNGTKNTSAAKPKKNAKGSKGAQGSKNSASSRKGSSRG